MTRRRALVGLFTLCLLALVPSIGPQVAAAATNGTTAFTCKKEGPEHAFTKAHCTAADHVGGEYEEAAVAENKTTPLLGTAGTTEGGKEVMKLKFTILGTAFELQAKGLDLEGTVQNLKAESGEHYVDAEAKLTLTNVSTLAPIGCKVKGEKIESTQLTLTTKGQGDAIQLAPVKGEVLAEFAFEKGCIFEGTLKLFGSVKGTPDGATLTFTHNTITTEKTLRLNNSGTGPIAGLEGSITLNGRDPVLEETSFTPLALKTVETP